MFTKLFEKSGLIAALHVQEVTTRKYELEQYLLLGAEAPKAQSRQMPNVVPLPQHARQLGFSSHPH